MATLDKAQDNFNGRIWNQHVTIGLLSKIEEGKLSPPTNPPSHPHSAPSAFGGVHLSLDPEGTFRVLGWERL